MFEVHPILKIEQQDLSDTLRPIEGFEPKEAEEAFPRYERGAFEITPAGDRVRIRMNMVGFNYVKFLMKLRNAFTGRKMVSSERRAVWRCIFCPNSGGVS